MIALHICSKAMVRTPDILGCYPLQTLDTTTVQDGLSLWQAIAVISELAGRRKGWSYHGNVEDGRWRIVLYAKGSEPTCEWKHTIDLRQWSGKYGEYRSVRLTDASLARLVRAINRAFAKGGQHEHVFD